MEIFIMSIVVGWGLTLGVFAGVVTCSLIKDLSKIICKD